MLPMSMKKLNIQILGSSENLRDTNEIASLFTGFARGKEIQPVHPKGDQSWVFIGRTDF